MKKRIPNFLTLFRLILVPVMYFSVVKLNQPLGSIVALLVFIIASISDYFDGMYARKYKNITDFGKIMDPIADKLLVIVAIFLLVIKPIAIIPLWILLVIVIREILVTLFRFYYANKGIFIAANIWGKLKTVFQIISIIIAFLVYILSQEFVSILELYDIVNFIFWITVIITILSAITYTIGGKK